MSDLHFRYLLIGGGVAASEAAKAIREIDREGDLLMVAQEINRPYFRPPLSKQFLRSPANREALFTQRAEWFNDNRVQLRTGRRAAHLDTTRNSVTLDNGEGVSFDRLLIATGGAARALDIPGSHLPNLFYLRTLEDADHLQLAMAKAKAGGQAHPRGRGRAAIIGGGLLGVELAGTLTEAGLHVDLAFPDEHPWRRIAGETAGRSISRILEARGVSVHRNDRAFRLEGDGRVQRVALASGETFPCDFAVAAVGITIHKDLLRGTPIAAEQAILADSSCRTSVRDIFAAGDCAALFDPLFGKHRTIHHCDSAAKTGRIAGINMAGGSARFESASYFDSEFFGLKVRVWGEARAVDRRIFRGSASAENPGFIEFGVAADGRLAQIIAMQSPEPDQLFVGAVERRLHINGNEEQLKDPSVPLESILKPE